MDVEFQENKRVAWSKMVSCDRGRRGHINQFLANSWAIYPVLGSRVTLGSWDTPTLHGSLGARPLHGGSRTLPLTPFPRHPFSRTPPFGFIVACTWNLFFLPGGLAWPLCSHFRGGWRPLNLADSLVPLPPRGPAVPEWPGSWSLEAVHCSVLLLGSLANHFKGPSEPDVETFNNFQQRPQQRELTPSASDAISPQVIWF